MHERRWARIEGVAVGMKSQQNRQRKWVCFAKPRSFPDAAFLHGIQQRSGFQT